MKVVNYARGSKDSLPDQEWLSAQAIDTDLLCRGQISICGSEFNPQGRSVVFWNLEIMEAERLLSDKI